MERTHQRRDLKMAVHRPTRGLDRVYYGDGSVRKETDGLNAKFDRSYEYDFGSRMTKTLTGAEARGGTDSAANIPYRNTYAYDAFSHRTGATWANFSSTSATISTPYTNNRINSGTYDFDGNQLSNPTDFKTFSYNAAGQMHHTYIMLTSGANYEQQTEDVTYDGDGAVGKVVTAAWLNTDTPIPNPTYKVRSTALGGQVVYEGGSVNVYAGGTRIWAGGYWTHQDANGHTIRSTDSSGNVAGDGSLPDAFWDKKELDPDGKQTGFSAPVFYPLQDNDLFAPMSNFGQMIHGQYTTVTMDGLSLPRDYWADAFHSLGHSSDLSLVGADSITLANLGIFLTPHYRTRTDGNLVVRDFIGWDYNVSDASQAGGDIWNIRPWLQRRFEAGLACDLRFSRIFGDSDAMMSTNMEPNTLLNSNGTNRPTRTRNNPFDESPQLGIVHLFSNAQGTGVNRTNAFTPAGYAATETNHYNTSSGELQNFRRFYYSPSSLSKYGYSGGLIINFTHIGPTTQIGNHILQGTGSRNDMGSVPVGVIGGFDSTPEVGGGSEGYYTHVHMIFNTWNGKKSSRANSRTRVDPRTIFCRDLGF